ncbi:YybH family protein [Streptomyces sp. KLOTTS4A1]|uniref:YybH family protein n=1 Tax=Streptomyces sp. KLOTTS4A1 TaxID=3390996 RepID=UPI0039F4FC30
MRMNLPAVGVLLAGLALSGPSATAATAGTGESPSKSWCERGFVAAVHEDNNAYDAHDIDRYTRILHPDLVVMANGEITVGRDAHLAEVRPRMEVAGWRWEHEILSTTVHGCKTGIAVMDFRFVYPPKNVEYHYSGTMTLVFERGRWLVAQDTLYELES